MRERARALRFARQLDEPEEHGSPREMRQVGVEHFLHLYDEVAIPGLAGPADARAGSAIVVIAHADAGSRAGLDYDPVALVRQHRGVIGQETHAALTLLGLARNADPHECMARYFNARRAWAMRSGPR